MHAVLCDECRAAYPTPADARVIDRVNPQTGEVTRVDALWECLADHCGRKPDFITPATPLMSAIFRALLANGNNPMSPEQLHKRVGKSNAAGILRVLLSADIENGVVLVEK
jgi:methyltransferase-like protein